MTRLLLAALFLLIPLAALAHPGGHGVTSSASAASTPWAAPATGAAPSLWLVPFAIAGLWLYRTRRVRGALASLLVVVFMACGGSSGATPTGPSTTPLTTPTPGPVPGAGDLLSAHFAPFSSRVQTRFDSQYLYVESDGMPDHRMMVNIRAWQQQVPLPQNYAGGNAWRIPLAPRLAEQPMSARTALFRGAIALAVNGVPIFNALNNRGEDSFLIGELDEFGGHAGRADDYHYHAAPLHLEPVVGSTKPIAMALDGFAIYGSAEPDGSAVRPLDQYNGHADPATTYHYHGTRTYPYINGGMRGVVSVQNDQIEPQPATTAIRPAGAPLNGATITAFSSSGTNAWSLGYQAGNGAHKIDYRIEGNRYTFVFTDPSGATRTETYTR